MKKLLPFLVAAIVIIPGCKKDDQDIKSRAGCFELSQIGNIGTKSSQQLSDDSVKIAFQLGDIKNSNKFYFLLSNGGDNPIFDVNLKTNNSQFTVSPENLSVLSGNETSTNGSIIPLISLGLIHGTQLNGLGFAELLPMGENLATLTITGKTIENQDTINLKSDFFFSVNAKMMDIKLFDGDQEIILLDPRSLAGGFDMAGLGFIRYYQTSSDSIQINNTGNVDITLRITEADSYGNLKDLDPIAILQNQVLKINIKEHFTVLSFDSEGTITENTHIQLGDDGNGYLAIEKISE